MFTYVHNVDAKVEDDIKYLTDVVKVEIKETGGKFNVTVFPAIQNGVETITTVPVHPKTVGELKEVPTYTVPTTTKVLVRVPVEDRKQDYAGANIVNWIEKTVVVTPILDEAFDTEPEAVKYYENVIAQLFEGDNIRNPYQPGNLRSSYESDNSRSH